MEDRRSINESLTDALLIQTHSALTINVYAHCTLHLAGNIIIFCVIMYAKALHQLDKIVC